MVLGFHCSKACGIFPDQEMNLCLLHWLGTFFATEPPGILVIFFFSPLSLMILLLLTVTFEDRDETNICSGRLI